MLLAIGEGERFAEALARVRARVAEARAAAMRSTRKKLGLNQAQAGQLFGGGATAFSEYARGKTHRTSQLCFCSNCWIGIRICWRSWWGDSRAYGGEITSIVGKYILYRAASRVSSGRPLTAAWAPMKKSASSLCLTSPRPR